MTKFINSSLQKPKEHKETKFKKCVEPDLISRAMSSPRIYKNVQHLYYDNSYGDVFLAWDDDENERSIYFGIKGDEFDNNNE